jgi:hypothetical protein
MSSRTPLSSGEKIAVAALVVAAVGVVIQIAAGHPYPTVPPVLFILLIPAGVLALGRWRWAPVPAVLAGLFLTVGLFASGASGRLFDLSNPADSLGLWVQTLAVLVETAAAIVSTIQNYVGRASRPAVQTR